ncbi:GDSL-motif lipase 2 [Striga asiatica]|uniref:GDSL-motif lipase 2 n=1 Tax=Striga asiatica TaxID=4170 RepID=A0A5A7QRM2_STRAF|nr:GDSL-motif lipase 2 [Striga asiatica]
MKNIVIVVGYVGHFRRSDNTVKQCRADFHCRVRRGEELCACVLGLRFGYNLNKIGFFPNLLINSHSQLCSSFRRLRGMTSTTCSDDQGNRLSCAIERKFDQLTLVFANNHQSKSASTTRTAVDSVSASQSDVQRRVSQVGRSNANSWLRFCVSIGCPTRSRVAGLGNCQASYELIGEEVKNPFTPPIASASTVMNSLSEPIEKDDYFVCSNL